MATASTWQTGVVTAIGAETPHAKTFRLRLAEPRTHRAGQFYVVRLTAPDGYHAQRDYSVANAPGGDDIELTVEKLPDGEVSAFLHNDVEVGDVLQVRGPIGRFFSWDGATPIVGVAGGSGVVPLMSMLRLARRADRADLMRLIVSVRSPEELYYADEIAGPETTVVYTRRALERSSRPVGRLTVEDLAPLVEGDREVYVCGSQGFCDTATSLLLGAGVETKRIRVSRFGPTA
ncbi:Ferredoxin-NADP reductase [Amycolatopsis pretoriensis]|uniref:Ferredoxin-NADP reductase n=1 Tax=Amycolatopsis pretoriensis TaxID=218821 RepID=A0A1H5Q3I6_9PSEU|nr:FAD-binding oxidoreductase [Amycolatopsis pretoriensis]SEF20670.1 Ferredoxin-NADP reductase [Amycolatopsis pretoriensis]